MSSDFDEMACLRVEDGYHGIGKVVSLAVCGMERKVNVHQGIARVFHVLSGRRCDFCMAWISCVVLQYAS